MRLSVCEFLCLCVGGGVCVCGCVWVRVGVASKVAAKKERCDVLCCCRSSADVSRFHSCPNRRRLPTPTSSSSSSMSMSMLTLDSTVFFSWKIFQSDVSSSTFRTETRKMWPRRFSKTEISVCQFLVALTKLLNTSCTELIYVVENSSFEM